MYYLYKHTNINNGKIYIGITSQIPEKRWGTNGINYRNNKYFWNAILKNGWDSFKHEIIMKDISRSQAEILEEEYIFKFKSFDRRYGYNNSLGGETNRHTEDTKKLLSKIGSGRKLSNQHKDNISKSLKGSLPKNRENGENPKRVKIVSINIETKKVQFFNSLKDASMLLGIAPSLISKCVRNERNKTNGFLFFYKDNFTGINNIEILAKKNIGSSKSILATSGKKEKIFSTLNEAAEFAGIHRATMRRYCNERKEYNGWIWSFK